MVVLTDLFRLILVALTLVIICLFVIVVYMIRGDSKSKAETSSRRKMKQKCLHFVGYLASEHPRGQPIPDECFGCTLALECIQKNTEESMIEAKVAPT